MMTFRKIAAKSDGRLLRAYFTENKPEPLQDLVLTPGRQLDSGERLTAYYTGKDSRATWRPDLSPALQQAIGADARFMPKDAELDRLFEAKRADTGAAWSKHPRKLSGFDLTLQPHKSVSLAAEFAQTPAESAAIRNAVRRANDATMRYVGRELGWARRGKGGEDGADPGDVAWVSFYHHTARPTLAVRDGPDGATYLMDVPIHGDPHDHIHNFLLNLVVTEDGRIGSLDTRALTGVRVHEFGAYFQAKLAEELRQLGMRIGYDKNEQAAYVEVVPQQAVDAFSKSHRQVLRGAKAFAKAHGLDWETMSAEDKHKILARHGEVERLAKDGGKNERQLWRDEAASIGWRHETAIDGSVPEKLSDEARFDRAYAFAARHLAEEFHTAAVIDHDKLRVHAARGLIALGIGGGPDDIDQVVALLEARGLTLRDEEVGLVTGVVDDKVRVTNTAQLRIEQSLIEHVTRAAADRSAALSPGWIKAAIDRSGLDFTAEPEHGAAQIAAIHALGQGGAFALLTGVAGSGKTTVLGPLVDAWHQDTRYDPGGRQVIGVATAWRQADALKGAGIRDSMQQAGIKGIFALQPLLASIEDGSFAPTRNTVLVIDEISQIAPRPMLRLLELQARTGMTIRALGDREQAQAIEAGDTIEILRRALPKELLPELLSTVRQVAKRDRAIAGLFCDACAGEALAMKREDGTARLLGGDQDQVIDQIAEFYLRRRDILRAAGSKRGITISVLTNEDAADISRAVRTRLKARGEIGTDETIYRAVAPRGPDHTTYDLPIATGDRLRLFRRTWAKIDGKGGAIGNNGDIVEVVGKSADGLRLRNKDGRIGAVEWRSLADPVTGRLMLGPGHALTIDAAQGITSDEHINALPRGSAGVTAFKAYVAESRARGASWTLVSEAAVHEAVKYGRAIGDATPITAATLWQRVGEDMSRKPYKALGIDLLEDAWTARDQATDAFLRQSRTIQAWSVDGPETVRNVRKRAKTQAVRNQLASDIGSLGDPVRRNGVALKKIRKRASAHHDAMAVEAFMRTRDGTLTPHDLARERAVRKRLGQGIAGVAETIRDNRVRLDEVGRAAREHKQSMAVDAFMRTRGTMDGTRGRSVTRDELDWARAQTVRTKLAGGIAGLDEQIRQNFAILSASADAVEHRLRARRIELEQQRQRLEEATRRKAPGSSPGF